MAGAGNSGAARSLLILGTRGVPAAHGGFETFAERLALWLVPRGWHVTVYCQGPADMAAHVDRWCGIERVHLPARRGALGTIGFDRAALADALRRPGLLLTLGYNTGYLQWVARRRGRRSVVNMDGIEWARAKYGPAARAWLVVNERLAARFADRLVADHPAIADHLARRAPPSRIATIAYGADPVVDPDPAPLTAMGLRAGSYLTLIARPEPDNMVLDIIRAFAAVPGDTRLAVAGDYDASRYGRACRRAAGDRVRFLGPIYDRDALAALRGHAIGYLHGHRVGGTNPSLVEALGAGNPVVAHDNRFNRWVAADAALYFADAGGIAPAVTRLIGDGPLRARLAQAARQRWRSAFTWPAILADHEAMLLREHAAMRDEGGTA